MNRETDLDRLYTMRPRFLCLFPKNDKWPSKLREALVLDIRQRNVDTSSVVYKAEFGSKAS